MHPTWQSYCRCKDHPQCRNSHVSGLNKRIILIPHVHHIEQSPPMRNHMIEMNTILSRTPLSLKGASCGVRTTVELFLAWMN